MNVVGDPCPSARISFVQPDVGGLILDQEDPDWLHMPPSLAVFHDTGIVEANRASAALRRCSTQIRPPWRSTILLADREPDSGSRCTRLRAWRRWKTLKTRSACRGSIPIPLSITENRHYRAVPSPLRTPALLRWLRSAELDRVRDQVREQSTSSWLRSALTVGSSPDLDRGVGLGDDSLHRSQLDSSQDAGCSRPVSSSLELGLAAQPRVGEQVIDTGAAFALCPRPRSR